MEAYVIALCEKDMLIIISVPVACEGCRNLVCAIALIKTLGMLDVIVVCDATILGHLLVISGKQQMGLILVA